MTDVHFWPPRGTFEERVDAEGLLTVQALSFQMPSSFFSSSWGSHYLHRTTIMQVQFVGLLVEVAKRIGLTIAFEELTATEMSKVVKLRTGIRVTLLCKTQVERWAAEGFVVDVCNGEHRKKGEKGEALPLEAGSWRGVTEDTIKQLYSLEDTGDDDQLDYTPHTGAEQAEGASCGIFDAFSTVSVLPEYDAADGDEAFDYAAKNRFRSRRIEADPETGHDPRKWSSYLSPAGGDDIDSHVWKPHAGYAARCIRYLSFGPDGADEASWCRGGDHLQWLGLPWVSPSAAEGSAWLKLLVADAGLYLDVDSMVPAEVTAFIRGWGPWRKARPIVMGSLAGSPLVQEDSEVFPMTERMHRTVVDKTDAVERAVEAGTVPGTEITSIRQWSLNLCRALFARDAPEGFAEFPGKMCRAYSQLWAAASTRLQIALQTGRAQRTRTQILRRAAYSPAGDGNAPIIHPHSVDVHHLVEAMHEYGYNASQVAAGVMAVCLLGISFTPCWKRHKSNYILLAGEAGCGKSFLASLLAKFAPACAVMFMTDMSAQALVYSKAMLDGMILIRHEAPQKVTDRAQVDAIDNAASEGMLQRWTVEMQKIEEPTGEVSNRGQTRKHIAAARYQAIFCANANPNDGGRGADASRRVTREMTKGPRAPETPLGKAVMAEIAQVSQLVTAGVAVMCAFAMYDAGGMPYLPLSTAMMSMFTEFVLKKLPAHSDYVRDNRTAGLLMETACNLWRRQLVADWMFQGRNTPAAARAIRRDQPLPLRRVDSVEFAAYARTKPLSGVQCVLALSLMPPLTTEAARKFIMVVLKCLAFTPGDALVEAPHPEDTDYFKTTVTLGSDNMLPSSFYELLLARGVAPIFQTDTRLKMFNEPRYGGKTVLKAETLQENAHGARKLLVHRRALEEGFRSPSPEQIIIIKQILASAIMYSHPDQRVAYVVPEDAAGIFGGSDEYNARREISVIEAWRMPGDRSAPCVWTSAAIAGSALRSVQGRMTVTVSEVVAGPDFGTVVARADGPLGPNPPNVRPKQLTGVIAIDGEFFASLPAIASGVDVSGVAEERKLHTLYNHFLLAAGVPPGKQVRVGPGPESLLEVTAADFVTQVDNPEYAASMSMYHAFAGDVQSDGGLGIFASHSDPHVRISNTSQLDRRLERHLEERERALYQAAPDLEEEPEGGEEPADGTPTGGGAATGPGDDGGPAAKRPRHE